MIQDSKSMYQKLLQPLKYFPSSVTFVVKIPSCQIAFEILNIQSLSLWLKSKAEMKKVLQNGIPIS